MAAWTTVKLKGNQQVIPRTCPNCLGPTSHSLRYGYKGWKGWLTRTTYFQTFYYCEPCCDQAQSAGGLSTLAFWMGLLGMISSFILMAVFAEPFRDPATHRLPDDKMMLGAALGILVAGLVFGGIYAIVRAVKRRRYPPKDSQVVWGPAVYYTGGAFLDVLGKHAVYRAARREWAVALVRENPDQADEATYQELVGAPRPVQAPDQRPFG